MPDKPRCICRGFSGAAACPVHGFGVNDQAPAAGRTTSDARGGSNLFVMVGLPGAGKTTLAESIEGVEIISTDRLRHEIHLRSQLWRTFYSLIDGTLWDGRNVIADSTALKPEVRERLCTIAWEREAECHAIVFPDWRVAYERNLKRKRVVPAEGMNEMRAQLKDTLATIDTEGFHTVTKVWAGLEELVKETIQQFIRVNV